MSPDYEQLYLESDLDNGLPVGLTAAIAKQETGHIRDEATRNRVRSPANAYGHMQFIPETGRRYGLNSYADLTDPVKSINAAGRYLGDLYHQFGRPDLTAAAYNAGEHRKSLREGRIPAIPETQKYVRNVMSNLASVQHAHGMMRKYSPSLAEQGMNFFIPPAYGADQPQGPGVMTDWKAAGEELDQIINEGTQQPGATDWDAAGAELEQIISEGAPQSGMSPTLQAAVRVGSRVMTNPVDLMSNALMAGPKAVAWGVNKLRPGTIDVPSVSGMVDKGLAAAGINPQAQSPEERALTAGLTAATTAPLMGASSLGSIAAQGLGAAASSASVDMAQQSGAGLPGQIAAGIVGGMVPGVGMSAMRGVGNTINRGTAPFRPGGKEAIAGRLLNKQASAPQTVLNRVDDPNINRAIIPGSAPTLAEVSQDPGISQLQRGMGRIGLDAGVDQINAVRVSQLDNLIHETLDRVNKNRGGRDVVESVRAVKHRIGAEFEQGLAARGIDTMALPVAPQTLSDRIKDLARKHEGNDALTGLIAKVSTQLGDEAPSFNKLWNMRQSLDDSIYEKWATASSASKGDMKRVGEQLRSAMNADLVAAVPEFQPFLSRYARMSRAEGRLKLGRKLKEGVQNMGSGIAGEGQLYGERTISLDKLQKIDFDKAQQRAGATLAPYQREAFDAATAEKRRANFLFSGGQAPRSDTAQNLALDQLISDDILGGLLGDNSGQTGLVGILRGLAQNTLGAPLTALTRSAKNDILRLVAKGLIDPQEGARLMRLGTLKQSESFAKKLQSGAETGVLSSIYSNMVR
jgi:hypothetical protein